MLHPSVPIVWGGWHPSLFPKQCVSERSVDAAVIGQGESTFAEVVDRLARRETLEGTAGCAFRGRHDEPRVNPPRAFADINGFPPHDYTPAGVETYFRRKGIRQFDYVSSQGCRFRCSFCADPTVFGRGWYGLAPGRVVRELSSHARAHAIEEVSFQDETFFTNAQRVEEIAEGFLTSGIRAEWTATMRSDQGSRLDDGILALCRRSGLRRVMIGVESGSPETLRRIHKDISVAQIMDSAEKCLRHRIGAILNFIVGFPGETDESVRQTLELAARLRAMSPDFEVAIFYFRPYPGTHLANELAREGYPLGESLEAWAEFDYVGEKSGWITGRRREQVERFKFYQRHAFGRDRGWLFRPLRSVSRWRIRKAQYRFPLEKMVLDRIRPPQRLS
jgi:radical SAM superfamily enzyme YgiQ (UPF0313 family)